MPLRNVEGLPGPSVMAEGAINFDLDGTLTEPILDFDAIRAGRLDRIYKIDGMNADRSAVRTFVKSATFGHAA